jgi:hypothetical protein
MIMSLKWTPEEKEILLKINKAGGNIKDVQKVLPYRSEASIDSYMRSLGFNLRDNRKREIDLEAFKSFMKERGK